MQEIADALKKQRESKGYSIDDLFQRTRINPDFLRAIDAGQFDILPDTYAKLFIKKYAQEVGLNVEEILAQYDKLAPAPAPAPPKPTPPPVHHKRNFQPIIFIAIGIGIVALLVWQIGQRSEKDIAAPLDATLSVPTTSPQTKRPENTSPTSNINLTSRPIDTAPIASSPTEQPTTTVPDLGDQTPETTPTTASPVLNKPEIIPETNMTSTPETTTPETESVLETEAQTALSPESLSAETPTEQQTAPTPTETSVTPNQPPERLTTNEQPPGEPKTESTTMPLPVVIAPEYPLLLSGIAQQTTQLVVKVDGRTLFDGVLQAGSRPRWTARNSLELILTDRSALALSLQNQPLQFDAATSQAIQLNIDRTQIRILPLSQ